MINNINYEEYGEIDGKMPLESLYGAMLPILKNYDLTAEFPADKPSLDYSTNGIEFAVLIGESPSAMHYIKWQESPYANGGLELTLESDTLVHTKTGDKLSLKIFITDYISGMTHANGVLWLTVNFRGEESEVKALKNAVAPVLTEYKFNSRKVSTSAVSKDTNDNSSADSIKNINSNSMTNNVNFDELTRKAFAPDWTDDDQRKLYTALLSLPEWHFIAVGEFPNAAPFYAVFPGYLDNLPLITAFTDDERLRSYVAKNSTSNGAGYAPIVIPTGDGFIEFSSDRSNFSFAPETFFKLLEKFYNHGIRGIIFNHGSGTPFFVELRQFRSIYDYLINENALAKTGVETDVGNNADHLTKLLEENADVIARFEQENTILSTIIKIKAKEVDAASEENREQIISKTVNDLESVRVENNMPPKLFRVFIESCLNEKKFLMPALAFAYVQRDKKKWEKLEQDKEFIAEYANWLTKKIIPGAELLMDEQGQKPAAAIDENIAENDFQTDTAQEKDSTADETGEKKSAESGVDFDELSRRIDRADPPMEDLNALYGAAFALPEWMFIARGELLNPRPYIASNPAYADNQPMIRAFTDTKRLQRFAQENNLTEADGSALMLTIPTANIVEYLEGFIPQGAYGVWFNSDIQSEGFFIPIKQLQPIKDHLAKINWQKKDAPKLSVETLQFVVREGLMLPSGEIKTAPYTSNVFWRVPENWLENGKIKAEHLRTFEQELSGGRSKTIEGAFYVPVDYSTKIFTPEDVKTTDWQAIKENSDDSCTFFIISETGEVRFVSAEEFQKDVDSYFQTTEISNQSPSSVETLIVQIKDGLGFPSGFVKASEDTLHLFCRVPSNWVSGEQLKPEYLEKIYAQFYGANWRAGNSDGSHYKILDSYTKIFPIESVKTTKFAGTVNQDNHQFFFYIGDENGAIRKVSSEEFQADVDASFQTHTTDEARKRQDNLANWGISETADGDFDSNSTINKVGAVNFDTLIAPFYEAIVPLLNDYKGTGEYVSLLRFEASGKSDQVESIAENSHGAYLQIRRFVYLNPKNGVRIGVNSIHSNQLRHVQSNAELIVSFELCKNLDNQTAVFYHAFQGPKSDVLNLAAAIHLILESVGYQPVQN